MKWVVASHQLIFYFCFYLQKDLWSRVCVQKKSRKEVTGTALAAMIYLLDDVCFRTTYGKNMVGCARNVCFYFRILYITGIQLVRQNGKNVWSWIFLFLLTLILFFTCRLFCAEAKPSDGLVCLNLISIQDYSSNDNL